MMQRCSRAAPGPFLTDHRAVMSTLNIKKTETSYQENPVRQVNKIKPEQWMENSCWTTTHLTVS